MTDIANWLESEIFEYYFIENGPVYAALHTDHPGDNADENEVDAVDYSRQPIGTSWWDISGGSPTLATTNEIILFDQAQSTWGTISHVSIHTAEEGGNPLFGGSFEAPRPINDGEQYEIREGAIRIYLD